LQLEHLEDRTVPSTLLVNTALDEVVPGDGTLSLRAAIGAGNSGDKVVFDAALAGQTISLVEGELFIDKSLSIVGLGANNLAVSGSTFFRVFDIASDSTVSISGLTVRDGHASAGGGIFNSGQLTLRGCTLTANTADGLGGAVTNIGTLTVKGSLLSGNTGFFGGGGINNTGTLSVSDSTVTDNHTHSLGGGVWNQFGAMATVTGSLVSYNTATLLGGGLDCDGTTLVRGSLVTHNTAAQSGGLDCDGPLTIQASVITYNHATAGFGGALWSFGAVSISGTLIAYNTAASDGGGIENGSCGPLASSDSVLFRNSAGGNGGGISNTDSAAVTVSNCLLWGNTAGNNGGGIANAAYGTVAVSGSLLTGNTATNAGGGVANESLASVGLTVTATTICGNSALVGDDLFNGAGATASISSDSTVCDIVNLGIIV